MSALDRRVGFQQNLPMLSAPYGGWVAEVLGAVAPEESRATCDSCAMRPAPGVEQLPGSIEFDASTKCCTYYPELPNFVVGNILNDKTAPGRSVLKERFAAGIGVTPFGVMRPPVYQTLYQHGLNGDMFGRATSMKCPFLQPDLRCGIWAHRESTCLTWFCKYERGLNGKRFWTALKALLDTAERHLVHWCVVQLDIGDQALDLLFAQRAAETTAQLTRKQLDNQGDRQQLKTMWGRWAGNEMEFYRECARLVGTMRWADVLRHGGPDLLAWERLVKSAYQKMTSTVIPEHVASGKFVVLGSTSKGAVVQTYTNADLVEVSSQTLATLPRFEGRPSSEVAAEAGLDEAELRKLLDFEILIPATSLIRRT